MLYYERDAVYRYLRLLTRTCRTLRSSDRGDLTPVYFGSALKEFGVVDLLAALTAHAPGPQPQPAEPAPVRPDDEAVTGFVFTVQANMNPPHRDRIAFTPQIRRASGQERVWQDVDNYVVGVPLQ